MNKGFQIGSGQRLDAIDEMALIAGIEQAIDFCLATGNVFAIFEHRGEFCQLFLDVDHDMHIESSFGGLARHAGFTSDVPEFDWLSKNFLPATWHARSKMAAGAMARAFIDTGMKFPAALTVEILPTGQGPGAEEPKTPDPQTTEGARTIGFLFGEDKPMSHFVTMLAPALGLDASASIDDVYAAIKAQIEADYGPLNHETVQPATADIVVELGGTNPSSPTVFHCTDSGLRWPQAP